MSLSCLLNRHRRSASLAWVDGGFVRSACKDCGVPLVRTQPRRWVPITRRMRHFLSV